MNIFNMKKKREVMQKINECDIISPNGGLTFNDVSGMGNIEFPDENGEPGSGDIPMGNKKIYTQVAPFKEFIKSRKRKKKFRKKDEDCAQYSNPKIYSHVDDFRNYVERTYDKMK